MNDMVAAVTTTSLVDLPSMAPLQRREDRHNEQWLDANCFTRCCELRYTHSQPRMLGHWKLAIRPFRVVVPNLPRPFNILEAVVMKSVLVSS